MTDPTMSSMTTYGSMDGSSVRIHGTILQAKHAMSRDYVESACQAVMEF